MQYARITGASVVAVDVNQARLESARELGAEHIVNAAEEDPVAAIQALGGADSAISTAATPKPFMQAMRSLARGGRLVCVGLPADNHMEIPIFETVLGALEVRGSIVGTRHDLEEVFELHRRGLTRVEYEERRLDEVNEAIEQVLDGSAPTPRLVFRIGAEPARPAKPSRPPARPEGAWAPRLPRRPRNTRARKASFMGDPERGSARCAICWPYPCSSSRFRRPPARASRGRWPTGPMTTRVEQIHLVYAIPSDGQDRALDTNGTIEGSVAGFQAWLDGQTRGRVLRIDTAGAEPDITFFKLSKTDDEMARLNPGIVTEIERQLERAGFARKGKIYAVYYDGTSPDRCGGAAWPPTLPGRTAAVYLRGKPCAPIPAASYWQFAMFHDVFHVAGFVPTCAPNHTLAGHVSDDPADLMYAGPQPWVPSVLDTGRDDYYEHSAARLPGPRRQPVPEPAAAGRNLTPNPSFERHANGWGTRNGTLERVAAADAPHGSYAVKASPSRAGLVFVGDCPVGIGCSVASTTAGATYVGAATCARRARRRSASWPRSRSPSTRRAGRWSG